MKLSNAQANIIKENLDLDVVDEKGDVQKQLETAFGEHTFFLNDKGLFVFQEENPKENGHDSKARLFVVAAWAGDEKDTLAPLEPKAQVDVLFDLVDGAITGGE